MGTLGERMKLYEEAFKYNLMPRTPIIIRVDGKAFHTFTRKMEKPWDPKLVQAFNDVVEVLIDQIQGCILAYHQSDEMTFVCLNDKTHETQPFFANEVNKINTICASTAAAVMTRSLMLLEGLPEGKIPAFDARCFCVPNEVEVYNNLVWRQQDAQRNAVSAWATEALGGGGRAAKLLHGKRREDRIAIAEEYTGRDYEAEVSSRFKHGKLWMRVWNGERCVWKSPMETPRWDVPHEDDAFSELHYTVAECFNDYYEFPKEK